MHEYTCIICADMSCIYLTQVASSFCQSHMGISGGQNPEREKYPSRHLFIGLWLLCRSS